MAENSAEAYKNYLLGFLRESLRSGAPVGTADVKLILDIDGNPGHLEIYLPGEITLQVLVKKVPEEPPSWTPPDDADPARRTS